VTIHISLLLFVAKYKNKFEMNSIVYNINLIFTKLYQTYHFIKKITFLA